MDEPLRSVKLALLIRPRGIGEEKEVDEALPESNNKTLGRVGEGVSGRAYAENSSTGGRVRSI